MKEIYRIDDNIFYHTKWQDRSDEQKFKQSIILPKNTYSPWLQDAEFLKVYEKAKNNTLLDVFRSYELWDLAKQFNKKEGDIIEVGVWRGGSALFLSEGVKENENFYLCDTFEGVVKATEKDNKYIGGEHSDTSLDTVKDLFSASGISNYTICKGIFPDETGHLVTSTKVKICHIDVDVYQSAKEIFLWVYPKLTVGAVVIFDDFGFAACEGITALVYEIIENYPEFIKIYNINGHAILIKTS